MSNMKKNIIAIIVIALVVIGGGAFYGGMKYGASQRPNLVRDGSGSRAIFGGQGGVGARRGGTSADGFVAGEIISKDEKSITVKLRDGGSKIIFVSASTEVLTQTKGALGDLKTGTFVTVMGESGEGGSVTAKSVQVRPAPLVTTSQGDKK